MPLCQDVGQDTLRVSFLVITLVAQSPRASAFHTGAPTAGQPSEQGKVLLYQTVSALGKTGVISAIS